eukprot:6976759-Prymnesium_polylepis.1
MRHCGISRRHPTTPRAMLKMTLPTLLTGASRRLSCASVSRGLAWLGWFWSKTASSVSGTWSRVSQRCEIAVSWRATREPGLDPCQASRATATHRYENPIPTGSRGAPSSAAIYHRRTSLGCAPALGPRATQ